MKKILFVVLGSLSLMACGPSKDKMQRLVRISAQDLIKQIHYTHYDLSISDYLNLAGFPVPQG